MDDTTLVSQHSNKKFLRYSIIHDIKILMDWLKANQLSLNLMKTTLMNVWDENTQDNIDIDGIIILMVKFTKFLGVNLDSTLSWSVHIDSVHKKLMTNKMMLSINKNMLTTDCLKSIYYAHIHSHLCYGLLAWGPMASKHAINELARIQDAASNYSAKYQTLMLLLQCTEIINSYDCQN